MEPPRTVVLVEGRYRATLEAARIDATGAFVITDLLLEPGEKISEKSAPGTSPRTERRTDTEVRAVRISPDQKRLVCPDQC